MSCSFLSNMLRGAVSVAVSVRPTLSKTYWASGKVLMILSVYCKSSLALMIKISGKMFGICNMSLNLKKV
jgi:hypothetical protein